MSININKRWNQSENSGHKSNYNIAANLNPPHPQPISKPNRRASYQFGWLCIEHVLTLIKYECNSILFVCIVGTVFSIISLVGWVQHIHTHNISHHFRQSQYTYPTSFSTCNCFLCTNFQFIRRFFSVILTDVFSCSSFLFAFHSQKPFKIIQNGINRNSFLFIHSICIDCVSSTVSSMHQSATLYWNLFVANSHDV